MPLLVLSKEGARRKVVEEAIEMFMQAEERTRSDAELLTLTYGFASLVLESEADQQWLKWRFTEMFDLLRESPAFKEIKKEGVQEGLEKGLEEGLEKGLEKGRQEGLETLRKTLMKVVTARFPKFSRLARGQAAIIDNPEVLEDLIVKMSIAQSLDEAQHYLIDWPETDSEDGS